MKAGGVFFFIFLLVSCNTPDNEIIEVNFEELNGSEITLSGIAEDITIV